MAGPYADNLGTRLKVLMKAKGVNNPEVAEAIGVDPVTVSQWRSGRQRPGDDTLKRLAEYLGTTPEHLRYGALSGIVREAVERPYEQQPRLARNLPLTIREYVAEFELRLVRAKVPEEDVEEAMRLLRSVASFVYNKGGVQREFPEEAVLRNMKGIGEDVIVPDLRERGYKVK